MNRMKYGDNKLLSADELDRFEKLFELINRRMSARN